MVAWSLVLGVLVATGVDAEASPLAPSSLRRVSSRIALSRPGVELRRETLKLRGLPVRGAFETVRRGPEGTQSLVASVRPAHEPQVEPDQARIDAGELPDLVAAALGRDGPVAFESAPQLVYLMRLGQPVLAWEVQLPLSKRPEPTRPTLWLSAMSGRLLDERENVRSVRARVYPENPSSTPEPIEVVLHGLLDQGPGAVLVGERIVSLNCLDDTPFDVVPYWEEGECYPAHFAVADAEGNFYVELPDVVRTQDNREGGDPYAELSMYYHAERFLEVMRSKGVEAFRCEPANMLANFRSLQPEGDLDFTPLNNAYYTNQCDSEKGPTMLFGQGSDVDFGYDGDVVYHELGHGMVALLTPEGLSGWRLRPDGSSPDAGAINEAIADYFAFSMTDDPDVGEYVGRFWASNTRPYIRSGTNEKRCPDNTVGQVHNDGEPFQAALWAVRSRLGAVVDDIVLEALTRMPERSTLEEGTAAILDVAAQYHSSGHIDEQGLALFERSFGSRGLIDCPRVITDPAEVESGRTMYLYRKRASVAPFHPGPMQLRYEVPEGVTAVEVVFDLSSRGNDPPDAVVLVKRGDAPIEFTYELVGVDDPGDATGLVGKIREVTQVSGDWDLEIEPVEGSDGDWIARVDSVRHGEVLHVALAGRSGSDQSASGVRIRSPGAAPWSEDEDETGDTDAEPDPGSESAGGREEVRPDRASAGGCGCRGGAEGPGWAWLWAVCPILLSIRRRR